jgi:hypothetical protein
MNETVTPNEVFEAIKYAQTLNPNDKLGSGAFKIDYDSPRAGNNGVTYYRFSILKKKLDKKDGSEKWDFVPFQLRFVNLTSKAKILKPDDEKRMHPGVKLQFAHDATYVVKTKDKKEVLQPYGAAKIMAVSIFRHLIKEGIKNKKITNENPKISGPVQTDFIKDKVKKIKEKLDTPIIRMEIPFVNVSKESDNGSDSDDDKSKKKGKKKPQKEDNTLKPSAKPRCDIYDQTKKIPENDPRHKRDDYPYELLTCERNGTAESITYDNIGEVLIPGSLVSGVDNMSTMSTSNMGYSLASRAAFLIVKVGSGYKLNPKKIFDMEEIEALDTEVEVPKQETKTEVIGKQEASDEEDVYDNLDD